MPITINPFYYIQNITFWMRKKDENNNIYKTGLVSFLIFILCVTNAKSQSVEDSITVVDYDSLTYENYLQNNWLALEQNSKKAIANGFENTIIKKRLAYAYFMQHNYLSSAHQYLKLYKQNSSDDEVKLMLYYNYKNTAQLSRARFFQGLLSSQAKDLYQLPASKKLANIDASFGYQTNDNYTQYGNLDIRQNNIFAHQALNKDLYFAQLGLGLNINRVTGLQLSYEGVQLSKYEQIQTRDSIYDSVYVKNSTVKQHALYAQFAFALPRTYALRLYAAAINTQYTSLDSKYALDSFYTYRSNYTFSNVINDKYSYLLGVAVEKDFRKTKAGLNVSYANFNNLTQVQTQLYSTWYPYGNTNLSFGAQLTYINQNSTTRYIPNVDATFKLTKLSWLSSHFLYGDLSNTTEANGLLINNISDKTLYRTGTTLFFYVNKKVLLHLTYRYSLRQSNYVSYSDSTNYTTTYNNYNNHLISIGLKIQL